MCERYCAVCDVKNHVQKYINIQMALHRKEQVCYNHIRSEVMDKILYISRYNTIISYVTISLG